MKKVFVETPPWTNLDGVWVRVRAGCRYMWDFEFPYGKDGDWIPVSKLPRNSRPWLGVITIEKYVQEQLSLPSTKDQIGVITVVSSGPRRGARVCKPGSFSLDFPVKYAIPGVTGEFYF